MTIQWFPGHMARTRRKIEESLALVDAVIEIRDARIPRASKNPEIDRICGDKPRLILLNKSDLSNPNVTRAWKKALNNETTMVLEVNAINGKGLQDIKPALDELLKDKHDRLKSKGLVKFTTRAMVVGIPNVGKSTFINKMAKNNIAKTGDRPGLTKNNQWIKTSYDIDLLDTPGVLWPKFEDKATGYNLAFTGAIKDEIMDTEELTYKLIDRLAVTSPEVLKNRYKLDDISDNPIENLDAIAKKRGCIMSGKRVNYNRISAIILDEFRGGVIGNISLEGPNDVIEEDEIEELDEDQKAKNDKKAKKAKKKQKRKEYQASKEIKEAKEAMSAPKEEKKSKYQEYQEKKKAKEAKSKKESTSSFQGRISKVTKGTKKTKGLRRK
jgi:ribosome biogenesis GTPase A